MLGGVWMGVEGVGGIWMSVKGIRMGVEKVRMSFGGVGGGGGFGWVFEGLDGCWGG